MLQFDQILSVKAAAEGHCCFIDLSRHVYCALTDGAKRIVSPIVGN